MRCVDEIRADGVAPVPVAEARQQAHKSGPKARRPRQFSGAAVHLQPKSARGLGRSPISAEGAVPLPLPYFINKRLIVTDGQSLPTDRDGELHQRALEHLGELVDTHDKRGRKKGCGAWTVRGTSLDAKTQKFIKLNCKCWDCAYCGPRRARRCRRSIAAWAQKLQLNKFVTLTLDPKKLNGEDSTKYLNRTFAKLRSILHRRYGKALSYIRVLEYQENGNAHFHLILNRFIEIEWLRAEWQAVGGGWMVGITRVREMHKIPAYISEYLSKDLLLSAPKGSRRVTTSRDIRLFEKPKKDAVWELLKTTIENLRRSFVAVFDEAFCETDKSLTTFTVFANVV
jgi:hypothetical protein